MKRGRRNALKVLAGTGALAASRSVPVAAVAKPVPPEAMGMLYDTTLCIGCKTCMVACRDANGLEPDRDAGGLHYAPVDLDGRTKNIIKLYKSPDDVRMSYLKKQCMHCVDPACASACMLHSLHKNEVTGIVEYDPRYCVGCRYCMMACPFNVAKFEFDKVAPKIVKCEYCRHRVGDAQLAKAGDFTRYPNGHGPACCEVCPRGAVIYGKRTELLQEAKKRLADNPGRYVQRVYGETEVGGTQVLYLSHVPFEKIGLPDFGERGVPRTAYSIQETLYTGFAAPVALYGVLGMVMLRNRKKQPPAAPPPVAPADARHTRGDRA
jgi:Fe-S-cluster-containing dehydrogenase component